VVSGEKLKTNKENAGKSTGPRSATGKKRASTNARRHGLSVSIRTDPALTSEIERLAVALAGGQDDPQRLQAAREAAEAEYDVLRVRWARAVLMHGGAGKKSNGDSARSASQRRVDLAQLDTVTKNLPQLERLDRYEDRALSRRRKAMRILRVQDLLSKL
jgi:hypothetical protein